MTSNDISGYILLSMPTNQVKPLMLLHSQSKSVIATSASIENLFIDSEVAPPMVSNDYLVSAGIDESLSMEVSVDSHLSLLEGIP